MYIIQGYEDEEGGPAIHLPVSPQHLQHTQATATPFISDHVITHTIHGIPSTRHLGGRLSL